MGCNNLKYVCIKNVYELTPHHVLLFLSSLLLVFCILLLSKVIVTHILSGINVLVIFLKCSYTKGLKKTQ